VQKEFKSPDDVPSEDIEEIAALLKHSETVEVSEDGFQIRRKNVRSPRCMDCAVAFLVLLMYVSRVARIEDHVAESYS
jgi:hypothetical protein